MKIKIIEQNTAICIVIILCAVVLSVFSYYAEGLPSVFLSIAALLLVLWSIVAWPHDLVYKITYLDQAQETHEMKCYISVRFSERQRQRCFEQWVPGKIIDVEEMEEVVHCPLRFRSIGHI
ncbi:hypothetical protein [Acinetobacter shaoyimingii]|uniref:Uncharacterized protein n=1 Tax=Acinetobacter shaoyimingii TaxID=2715164 RepID=A0A6G8RU08_9GAMM|nr:hypothetical protein [Acinetobacter shaoyimingii]NHB58374.1 hypothetical protein [Acinetobacter shaoyimingii]QIO05357.1 hypothetical protein G8E00_05005 [Acinetobacter shaoyimingii]